MQEDSFLTDIARRVTLIRFQERQLDSDVLEQLAEDCAERLENILNRECLHELTRLGKENAFDKYLDTDRDPEVFLRANIREFDAFVKRSLRTAITEIAGARVASMLEDWHSHEV